MSKILIAGYYGYHNSGDDAILTSICEDIKRLNPAHKITILSNSPEVTAREYGLKSVYRFSLKEVIFAIKNTDVVVMGGGSLLQDKTSTRSLLYYLFIIAVAKKLRKKCMLYANGIGPVNKPFNRLMTTWIGNKIDTITLREHLSLKPLEKLRINKPKVVVTSDPVFNLELKDGKSVHDIFEKEGVPEDKPYITVMFRSWEHEEHFVKTMAKACDQIITKYDFNIVFVPMKYPSDLIVSMEIMKKMKHTSYVLQDHYEIQDVIGVISGCEFVMAMRLHALLYAAIKNVPMIGFNYDPKVRYYVEELGMKSVEDLAKMTAMDIMKQVDELMVEKEEIKEVLSAKVSGLKKMANKNKNYLEELIK